MRVKVLGDGVRDEKAKDSIPYDYEILLPQIKGILIRLKSLKFGKKTYNAIRFLDYSLPDFVRTDLESEREDLFAEVRDSSEDLSDKDLRKKLCMDYFQLIKKELEDHGFLRDSTSLTKESL